MRRLLDIYRKMPSPTNRAKLQTHLDRHPMAVVIASLEELEFLRANEFKV